MQIKSHIKRLFYGHGAASTFGGSAGDIVTYGLTQGAVLELLMVGWDEYDRKNRFESWCC
jgi:hypothetical protein